MKTLAIAVGLQAPIPLIANSADTILKKADEIRNPSGTYRMEVSVDSSDGSTNRFEINIGGKNRSLIRTLSPAAMWAKTF